MITGSNIAGIAFTKVSPNSLSVGLFSAFGHFSLFARTRTTSIKVNIITMPINIPEVNMLPIDAPVIVAYTTIIMLGGIIGPSPPETTNNPAVRSFGYPIFTISG